MSLRTASGSLRQRLARMEHAAHVGAFSPEQIAKLNETYKEGEIPAWALFILLIQRSRFMSFYEDNRREEEPFSIEAHVKWNNVMLGFRQALSVVNVPALNNTLPQAAGQSRLALGDAEAMDSLQEQQREALREVAPEIVELLLLATYSPNPSGYVMLWTTGSAFSVRYYELLEQANTLVGGWFVQRDMAYGDRKPEPEPEPEAEIGYDSENDVAPCPRRDPPKGNNARPPCDYKPDTFDRDVDAIYKQQGASLTGASVEEIATALQKLEQRFGGNCSASLDFAYSTWGRGLGLLKNQDVWQLLCERKGWLDPCVLKVIEREPPRRVYPQGQKMRFVLAVEPSGRSSVRQVEPEYRLVGGQLETQYDWRSHYEKRCREVRGLAKAQKASR